MVYITCTYVNKHIELSQLGIMQNICIIIMGPSANQQVQVGMACHLPWLSKLILYIYMFWQPVSHLRIRETETERETQRERCLRPWIKTFCNTNLDMGLEQLHKKSSLLHTRIELLDTCAKRMVLWLTRESVIKREWSFNKSRMVKEHGDGL